MIKSLFILLLLSSLTYAQYDNSVVVIKNLTKDNAYYGTGVVISQKDIGNGLFQSEILTSEHIFSACKEKYTTEIMGMNGIRYIPELIIHGVANDDLLNGEDLAIVEAKLFKMKPLEIAKNPPPANSEITTIGFGGYTEGQDITKSIRYLKGKLSSFQEAIIVDCTVTYGDSGGPMIYNNEVVSIATAGLFQYKQGKNKHLWFIFGPKLNKIQEFTGRINLIK